MSREFPTCTTCVENGVLGSCAPLRCYCGHETCPAFASYVPREHIKAVIPQRIEHRETEAERANRYKNDD